MFTSVYTQNRTKYVYNGLVPMSKQESPRNVLISQLKLMLADKLVDVELDIEHYNLAIDIALDRFRQRSSGSTEESYLFLTIQPDQQKYTLPTEVQDVKRLYRRGVGANSTGGGILFDPVDAVFSNVYLLQSGKTGGLATWEFFSQYRETIGRVFGSEIAYTWENSTHTLTLLRRVNHEEDVIVHVFNEKPEISLLTDTYTKPWIRDYSLAQSKFILGTGRGKYTSGLVGPQGTVTLDGEALKEEARAEMERLEQEILNFNTGSHPMPFIIG